MMRADGKKTILKKDGDTIDIVKACVSVFAQNWRQVEEIKSQFASKTLFETLCKLSDFLRRNISYKIDPQGEQWIKTPARFLADGTGDCKSYSIFQMSVLTALGYECGFRFVSYRENGDYSHVYTIAKDERGELVPLDVVGIIQANIKEGDELDYVNKKDIMNTTCISRLSGIEVSTQANKITFSFSNTARVNVNFAKSCLLLYSGASFYEALSAGVQRYDKQADLDLFCKTLASFVATNTAYSVADVINETDHLLANVRNEARFYLSDSVANSAQYKSAYNWLSKYVVADNFVKTATKDTNAFCATLAESAFVFLYLLIPDKKLSKVAFQKKQAQRTLLERLLERVSINYPTAINILKFGLMAKGLTPEEALLVVKGKLRLPQIGEAYEVAPNNGNNVQQWGDKILDWGGKISDIFKDWFGDDNDPVTPSPVTPVTPSTSDFNSNILLYVGGAVALVLGLKWLKGGRKK